MLKKQELFDFDKDYNRVSSEHRVITEKYKSWDNGFNWFSSFCRLADTDARQNFRGLQGVVRRLEALEEELFRFDAEKASGIDGVMTLLPNIWDAVKEEENADSRVHSNVAKLKSHRTSACWCGGCQDLARGQVGEENHVPPQ